MRMENHRAGCSGNAAPACDHRFRDPGNHAAAV